MSHRKIIFPACISPSGFAIELNDHQLTPKTKCCDGYVVSSTALPFGSKVRCITCDAGYPSPQKQIIGGHGWWINLSTVSKEEVHQWVADWTGLPVESFEIDMDGV